MARATLRAPLKYVALQTFHLLPLKPNQLSKPYQNTIISHTNLYIKTSPPSHQVPFQNCSMEESEGARYDELLVIKSIYGDDLYLYDKLPANKSENTFNTEFSNLKFLGILRVFPEPVQLPYKIRFETSSIPNIETNYLPPIFLKFELPEKYPGVPPKFSIECLWLKNDLIESFENKLLELWTLEKSEVLYLYADYLQNQALEEIGLGSEILINDEIVPIQSSLPLKFIKMTYPGNLLVASSSPDGTRLHVDKLFVNWKNYKLQTDFNFNVYSCGICFDFKKGRHSVALTLCGHVYCRDCLGGFFKMLIREGMMLAVLCPHEACRAARKDKETGCKTILPASGDIENLVGTEAFARYQRLLRKQLMELNPLVTWCPICEEAVPRKVLEEKLCQCPSCGFAFCRLCNRTWHGNQTFCLIHHSDKVTEQYFKAREAGNLAELTKLEFQYGKNHLSKLMADFDAQRQFEEWRNANAQPCPSCKAVIEKAYGCNHMTCPVCDQHFCYICGEIINKLNPYLHFNDIGSRCHMMLFEGVADDDDFFIDPFDIL